MNNDRPDPAWLESQLVGARWKTASSGGTTCIEVAFLPCGIVALRDSKNPTKPAHIFNDAEYESFVAGILRGELRRP